MNRSFLFFRWEATYIYSVGWVPEQKLQNTDRSKEEGAGSREGAAEAASAQIRCRQSWTHDVRSDVCANLG